MQSVIDEARSRHILLPTRRAIDLLCHRARARSEWLLQRALTTGLTDETKNSLDALLKIAPEMTTTRLTWLRNASQSPAPTNILGLIERVEFLRKLGIDRERQQAIPASAFDRIAREALKISAQHLAEAVAPRRHALLTAAALSLETGLTDATLLMFDKLMGSLSRKAERRSQEKAAKSARNLQEKLRALTGACTAMIRARENHDDPFIAIERQMKMGWSQFVTFVTETEAIVAPDQTDPKAELLRRYATVRKIAAPFLEAFTFKATPSAKPIIDALDVLKALYRTGQRSLPAKAPIRFIRRVWRSLVIQGGEIDRKAYELCVFFELRDRLRAGDIWVEGSRQYQDFESYLIPEPTFALLKAEGPLPVAIDTDVESYLAGRRAGLDREIEEVARRADQASSMVSTSPAESWSSRLCRRARHPRLRRLRRPPTRCCRPARSRMSCSTSTAGPDLLTASRISATAGCRTTSRPCSRRSWPTASISASIAWPTRFGASPIGSSRWFTTGISGRRAIGRLSLG